MATKAKSHSGAKKRFKVTASGKVLSKKQGNNHLLTKKAKGGQTNKAFRYGKVITGFFAKSIKNLIHN